MANARFVSVGSLGVGRVAQPGSIPNNKQVWVTRHAERRDNPMRKRRRLTALMLAAFFTGAAAFLEAQSFKPQAGFVPDEKTAIAVGRAILDAIYGEKQTAAEEPFSASLHRGVWTIKGSNATPNGGTAEIEISKETAAVLKVNHGK